jgi:hypothetical protein
METITVVASAPHTAFPTFAVVAVGVVLVALVAWQLHLRRLRGGRG